MLSQESEQRGFAALPFYKVRKAMPGAGRKKKLLFRSAGSIVFPRHRNRNKIIRIPVRKKHGGCFCCGVWHPRWNKPPGSAASPARTASTIRTVFINCMSFSPAIHCF